MRPRAGVLPLAGTHAPGEVVALPGEDPPQHIDGATVDGQRQPGKPLDGIAGQGLSRGVALAQRRHAAGLSFDRGSTMPACGGVGVGRLSDSKFAGAGKIVKGCWIAG